MINPKVEEFIFNNIFIKLKYGYEYEVTRSEYNILKRLRKDFSKIDKEDFEKILLAIRI
ncbi:MAG: hypothetical protein IMZ52_01190 [Actinobacteria bacterium]|nr:hypothetical protein [Actinomycetota bacterium]